MAFKITSLFVQRLPKAFPSVSSVYPRVSDAFTYELHHFVFHVFNHSQVHANVKIKKKNKKKDDLTKVFLLKRVYFILFCTT